ncbi:DUF3352 domain-containing protein [Phytoactinopolyspora mesophila]|uniref:DUF3352 domain-containing protein n=1 Tax=Phytoactinopolyspora mesophila TaxID=2650750 RepID=A0A7K3M989_9ACTN|nr:DUF3352 domain-containing protein [Phytoactinopolyspora mesophila]NDL59849.1 DUF3352 domain-containing protein [Phytoactinopolyspora mesophila]
MSNTEPHQNGEAGTPGADATPPGPPAASSAAPPPPPGPPAAARPGPPMPPPPPPPTEPASGSASHRRGLLIGALVAAVIILVPGAVFAWRALDGGGTQPHDVLPGDSVGYLRLDLDPSATQKINAVRFLGQFPALDTAGLTEDLDLREWMIEEFAADTGCDIGFTADVEPWLGDRMGAAALPPDDPHADPEFVLALQVEDDDAAETAMRKIQDCAGPGAGHTYLDGYLILAETQQAADQHVQSARNSSLGDNPEFRQAMDQLGDPGVASAWISGIALFEAFEPGMMDDVVRRTNSTGALDDPFDDPLYGDTPSPEELREMVEGSFRSVAMTFRFNSDYAEIASVVTGDLYNELGGDGVRADVPETTALLFGSSNLDTYVNEQWDTLLGSSPQDLAMLQGMAAAAGLRLPEDVGTMLGTNFVFAVDSERMDLESMIERDDFSSLDFGVQVRTEPDAFDETWQRLRVAAEWAAVPLDEVPLVPTDDGYVIASNDGYSSALIDGGTLGDSDVYTKAVKDADSADAVFFLHVDAVKDSLLTMMAGSGADEDLVRSVELIDAIGYSTRIQDGYTEATVRITVG